MRPLRANPIQGLRRILRDQYDFHSIVKELIQNADDAKATQFHIGRMSDWPDNLHPLLNSPAIVVLNDGEFTEADAEAICRIDVGNRGADIQTIGKFGLGMKSVFHLCEAFFFLASDKQQRAQNGIELLNPWYDGSDDSIHYDWGNNLEAVSLHLAERIQSWQHGCKRWFCLVLPLRTKQQLNGKEPIIGRYPKIEDFFKPDLPRRIASLMPMLHYLTSLTIWGDNLSQKETIKAKYKNRCTFPKIEPGSDRNNIQGRTSGPVTMNFGGKEILLNDPVFQELKYDERWPTTQSFDRETGATIDMPEAAEPHCAAVFSCIPTDDHKDKSCLQIRHAVFLPLTEELCKVDCDGGIAFQLLLHGYFFLDAGRREIISSSDGRLESEWNEELIVKGLYPLVLRALKIFADFSKLDTDQVRNLTKAISKSSFYKENKTCICSRNQWIWRISQEENRWQLLSENKGFFELPAPPDDSPDLPFEVFPKLGELRQNQIIIYKNQPRLSRSTPASWGQSPHLTTLLNSLSIDSFTDEHLFSYLISFLRQVRLSSSDNLKSSLVKRAKKALKEFGLDKIREDKEKFKEFLRLLGNNYWISFSVGNMDAILSKLFDLNLSQLLLPYNLSPSTGGQLSLDDADKILSRLTQMKQISPSHKSIFALQVVEKTIGSLETKRARLGEYSAFLCQGGYAEDKREQLFSWNEIHTLMQKQWLFAGGSLFAVPLQKAIRGVHLFHFVKVEDLKPFHILFEEEPPSLDKSACFKILGEKPTLKSPEHRSELLQSLQRYPEDSEEYRKAMRYLLHGSKAHYDDTQSSLLRAPRIEYADLLGRLAHEAMAILGDEWRWLQHEELVRNLSDFIADELNIKHIDFNAIEELLKDTADLTWLSDIHLSQNEKRILLRKIQNEPLWQSLPLHKTVYGQYVSLDGCYYQTERFQILPPAGLNVTIIQRTNDVQLNAKYEDLCYWDAEAMLGLMCEQNKPDEFWKEILDALNHLQAESPKALKNACWIPTTTSGAKSPKDFIYLPEIENELTRILADPELDGAFFSLEHIQKKVKNRPEFEIVKEKLFPRRDDALEMLGACLSYIEKYYIGDKDYVSELDIQGENLSDLILRAFEGVPQEILPVYELLQALLNNFPVTSVEKHLLLNLLEPIGIERTIYCLNFLSKKHEETPARLRNKKEIIFKVHCWYIKSFIKDDGNCLEDIRLLNRNGEWESPSRLCFDAQGIDNAYLLNVEQGEILNDIVSHNRIPQDAIQDDTDDTIQEYFKRWEGLLPNQVIGGFLALLGEDYNELAQEYLQPLDLGLFLNQIILEEYEDYQLSFRFCAGDSYQVINLIGEWFDATISQTYKNIFIGDFDFEDEIEITLREFEPSNHTAQELTDLLFESAKLLISEVYSETPLNLEEIWERLSKSSQLELKVTQKLILKNALLYFKQLGGISHLPKIWDTIRSWKSLERRLVEVEVGGDQNDTESVEDKLRKLSDKFQEIIESAPDVQNETLDAVRQKMKEEFQYSRSSIPFELFQNSDDAAFELTEMVEDAAQIPLADMVNVTWNKRRLVWIHWGRQINEFRRGNISSEEGRGLGYDADLENMLLLSSSDKDARQGKVTGKYGLGFKSVFLLTDTPRVLSGQLGFEVVGGFFPKLLSENERKSLGKVLNKNSNNSRRNIGTVFKLRANKDNINALPEVIEGFKNLVPILLIFARTIKRCRLNPSLSPEDTKDIIWHETPVPKCQNVFTGKIRLTDDESKEPVNVVVLRGKSHSAFLMAVGTTGFEKLPDDIPTFWVTAPTTEKLKTGFAVNGPFALDIGRAQLAGDVRQNDELARNLGADFGSALVEMFESASYDWSGFCNSLGLAENNSSHYKLWHSLWSILSKGIPHDSRTATELLKRIFWGNECGMACLLQAKNALPTGLPGEEYKRLTRPINVRYMAQGIMDEKAEEILPIVSDWESFSRFVRQNNIISHSRVGSAMKRLYPQPQCNPLKLKDIIEWELGESGEVSAEKADRLGRVVTRSFLDELERKNDDSRRERGELRGVLRDLHFKAQNGLYQAANDLLVIDEEADNDDREESLRAAFAPEDRVLNSSYSLSGISFFKACRSHMNAPSELLAEWGRRTPSTREKGIKFLKYLVEGRLGREVGQLLSRRGLENTWLFHLRENNYFNEFEGHKQLQVLGTLGFNEETAEIESVQPPEPAFTPPPPLSPSHILEKIYKWWESYKDQGIQIYEKQIYVQGEFPNISASPPDSLAERTEWLKFLLYGILHSVGRTSHGANQNFVRLCTDSGWLSRLAEAHKNREEWLKTWDQYIEDQIQDIKFFHWMKQLLGLFVVARRLDDYVEAFLAINQIQGHFSLNQITSPRASEIFQGGGPDAPPISKILGIGAWFIMRELVRKGIIKNENAYQHCYVPVKRVRHIVERMDGPSLENSNREDQSILIYEFLAEHLGDEKATFNLAFDIPLQFIAEDDNLWHRFFNEARGDVEDEEE